VVVDVVEHTGTAEAAVKFAIRDNCIHDRVYSDPLGPEMEELEQRFHNSVGELEAHDVKIQSPGPGAEGDREDQSWVGRSEKVAELEMAAVAVVAVVAVVAAIVVAAVVVLVAAVVVAAIAGDAIAAVGLVADALLLGSIAEPVLGAEVNVFAEMASGKESGGVACFGFAYPRQTCYEVS
jgi:hypothetical protein